MTRLSSLPPSVQQAASLTGPVPTTVEEYIISRCLAAKDGQSYLQSLAPDVSILAAVSPACTSGLQLYNQLSNQLRSLPTGCHSIDHLLGNGLREGHVVEVAGPSASGKTQVCLSLAAQTASRGEGVVYIDTTNSFNTKRVCQLAKLNPGAESTEVALRHISVVRPHSLHQLLGVLEQLTMQLGALDDPQELLRATIDSSTRRPGSSRTSTYPRLFAQRPTVLIVDSVSAVISPVIGHLQHGHGHTLMVAVARALKSLAACFSLGVLVTNHVTPGRGGAREDGGEGGKGPQVGGDNLVPALGEVWRQQVHCRVQLQLLGNPDEPRLATLTACNTRAVGGQECFQITTDGLLECPA